MNEHPTGWIGFRVTLAYGGEAHQKYFSTRICEHQDDRCLAFKRLRLQAELQDATWKAESALFQYKRFVSENHPTTLHGRGLGFTGMTISFTIDRRGRPQAVFLVHSYEDPGAGEQQRKAKEFTFRSRPYSVVWRDAVNFWAEAHGVLDEDRDRILAAPPPPSIFSELRRAMNEQGADIPTDALEPIFREQRERLAAQRVLATPGFKSLTENPAKPEIPAVEADIASWFEQQTMCR